MRYEKLAELCERLELRHDLVQAMLDDGLLRPRRTLDDVPVVSKEEADELRVAATLIRELDVNLEGVEVILPLRRRLLALQREMHELLERLREELLVPRGYLPQPDED